MRGYRGNFPAYAALGPEFDRWMRRVAADEARHYAGFLGVLLDHMPPDLERAERVLAEIRGAEGEPYRATFVLDHDDPVYGEDLYGEAARLLLRQLRKGWLQRRNLELRAVVSPDAIGDRVRRA